MNTSVGLTSEGIPLSGFNWGAFSLTWIWALRNRSFNLPTAVLLVLCFFPYVGFLSAAALAIYSGRTGTRRAWTNGRWHDREHFVRVQRRWSVVGLIQFALVLLGLVLLPPFYLK
jgi:hypothetical protein